VITRGNHENNFAKNSIPDCKKMIEKDCDDDGRTLFLEKHTLKIVGLTEQDEIRKANNRDSALLLDKKKETDEKSEEPIKSNLSASSMLSAPNSTACLYATPSLVSYTSTPSDVSTTTGSSTLYEIVSNTSAASTSHDSDSSAASSSQYSYSSQSTIFDQVSKAIDGVLLLNAYDSTKSRTVSPSTNNLPSVPSLTIDTFQTRHDLVSSYTSHDCDESNLSFRNSSRVIPAADLQLHKCRQSSQDCEEANMYGPATGASNFTSIVFGRNNYIHNDKKENAEKNDIDIDRRRTPYHASLNKIERHFIDLHKSSNPCCNDHSDKKIPYYEFPDEETDLEVQSLAYYGVCGIETPSSSANNKTSENHKLQSIRKLVDSNGPSDEESCHETEYFVVTKSDMSTSKSTSTPVTSNAARHRNLIQDTNLLQDQWDSS
jgi:hypothetical protein